jgi:nucleotide-binding universal stress UspA family protein
MRRPVGTLLLGLEATMTLVHVASARDLRTPDQERLPEMYERGARQLLADLSAELTGVGDVAVETLFIEGDPADELLAYARRGGFELVACGTQGGGAPERYFTGSLAAALLREARCAVLLAPPRWQRRRDEAAQPRDLRQRGESCRTGRTLNAPASAARPIRARADHGLATRGPPCACSTSRCAPARRTPQSASAGKRSCISIDSRRPMYASISNPMATGRARAKSSGRFERTARARIGTPPS